MSKTATAVLTLAIVAVVVQSFRISAENRGLSRQVSNLLGARLAQGDALSPLIGVDTNATRREVRFSESAMPTLVLTASFDCPACQRTFASWRRLSENAAGSEMRTVIVFKDGSFETRRRDVADHQLGDFISIFDPTYATYGQLRMTGVPTTAVVASEGTVLRSWFGALDSMEKEAEVANYLRSLRR